MGSQATKKEEKYIDIEDLLKESLSDKNVTGDKEDMVLEYLCQTISKTDSYDALQRKARDAGFDERHFLNALCDFKG